MMSSKHTAGTKESNHGPSVPATHDSAISLRPFTPPAPQPGANGIVGLGHFDNMPPIWQADLIRALARGRIPATSIAALTRRPHPDIKRPVYGKGSGA